MAPREAETQERKTTPYESQNETLSLGVQILSFLDYFPKLKKRYADIADDIALRGEQIANRNKTEAQRLYHLRTLKHTFELMYSDIEEELDPEQKEQIRPTLEEDSTELGNNLIGQNANESIIPPLKQCYRSSVLEELLDISRSTVHSMFTGRQIIGFQPSGRNRYYPAFQFTNNGVIKGLDQVLNALGCNNEDAITFLRSPNPELEWKLPLDELKKGKLSEVIDAASVYKQMVLESHTDVDTEDEQ